MGGTTSRVTEPRWGARSQWPLRTFLCPELKQKLSVNARLMLGHIFAQSALLYALLFVIINIYSVYSIYFGLGHINFIQEYIIYKEISMFELVWVGSEIERSTISQISFVKGQRKVFTCYQNSRTHFRFY